MKVSDILKLQKCKHISEFTEDSLVNQLGLYDSILIDVLNIKTVTEHGTGSSEKVLNDEVSVDVKTLHKFLFSENPLSLPCPYCRKRQPFKPIGWSNPISELEMAISSHKHKGSGMIPFVNFDMDDRENDQKSKPFMDRIDYQFGNDRFVVSPQNVFDGSCRKELFEKNQNDYRKALASKCMQRLLLNASEIRKDYECTMNSNHRCFIGFKLKPAIEEESEELEGFEQRSACDKMSAMNNAEKETNELYDKYRYCLIAQKIAQFPSMYDFGLFDAHKYIKVLSDHYHDYTRALLLYSHGIGAGAFVYLRRIFEYIIEEIHQECIKEGNWDEESYKHLHFDQKLDYLERKGKEIIPKELKPIKNKLYDVLSVGVHELGESECKELFPYLKDAIDIFLDMKIAKQQKEKKIKEINTRLLSFSTKEKD